MAVFESTKLRAQLATLLELELLEDWAREVGLFERRHRKLRPAALVATLVLGALVLPDRTIASLRRLFCQSTKHWRCRLIELLIRRMRQQLSLDPLSSANAELVEALLWASLCALALVGALHQRL